jgi:uncharacterized membrane protein HdeD (DUF308 family)
VARRDWLDGTRAVLNADARETAVRSAVAYFRFINHHRVGAYVLITAVAVGVFVFLWRAVSLSAAIVAVGLCLAYGTALAVVAAVRFRRPRGKP